MKHINPSRQTGAQRCAAADHEIEVAITLDVDRGERRGGRVADRGTGEEFEAIALPHDRRRPVGRDDQIVVAVTVDIEGDDRNGRARGRNREVRGDERAVANVERDRTAGRDRHHDDPALPLRCGEASMFCTRPPGGEV